MLISTTWSAGLKIRKMLEQSILEMQETWCSCVRGSCQPCTNALSNSIINLKMKRISGNAMPAGCKKGDENLARQALERKKSFAETANTLKANLDQQSGQIDTLKRSLIT